MASVLVFFLLFLLQFVILPFGTTHYEVSKVVVFELAVLCLLVISKRVRFSQLTLGNKDYYKNELLVVGLCIVSLLTICLHYSEFTFLGNGFRLQGTFLFWLLLFFSWLASTIPLPAYPKSVYVLLLVGLVLSVFSGVTNLDGRSVGTLGEPNALAAAAVFLWPWLVTSQPLRSHDSKFALFSSSIVVGMGILLSLFIILLSGSRSGLLALGIQVAVLLGAKFLSLKTVTFIGLLLLLSFVVVPLLDKQTLYENRGEIWKTAVLAGYEHPLLGFGFGNVEVAMKAYNQKLYNNLRGYYVDSAHNIFLDFWVEGGMVGLTCFVLLVFIALKQFVAAKQYQSLLLLMGLLTVLSFNPGSIITLIQFWWLIGRGVFSLRQG